jgi:hypothetical protein
MMAASEPREAQLRRRLAAPLGSKAGSEHPDPELVVAHASNELSPEYSLAITRHLLVCDDGRCTAVVRDVVAGSAVTRDVLYGREEAAGGSPSEAPEEELSEATSSPSEAPGDNGETQRPPAMAEDNGETQRPPAMASASATEPRERTFECPDDLWDAFVTLAQTEGASVDHLLDLAMTAFAEQRSSSLATGRPPAMAPAPLSALREVTFREAPPEPPPRERNTPTLQRAYLPRAPAASWRAPAPPPSRAEPLCLILEGVRHPVTKERFVVGRGGRGSDVAIDDPGVSRQHAVIERAGGAYYLVDMGSTNGVEYEGERIARKEIAHGDRFRIGDHEIEFLFG